MVRLAAMPRYALVVEHLHDDVLADMLACYMHGHERSRTDCHMLDLVRAEYHRRHAPVEPERVCSRCLLPFDAHDEFDTRCPDDHPCG